MKERKHTSTAKMYRTSLLPKSIKGREQVRNWRPITIGNLVMWIYERIWGKRTKKRSQIQQQKKILCTGR